MPKLTPVQVIANALQVERVPGTTDNPFIDVDGEVLRAFASDAIRMLEAYGYRVVPADSDPVKAAALHCLNVSAPGIAAGMREVIAGNIARRAARAGG